MRAILFSLIILTGLSVSAQRECATTQYIESQKAKSSSLINTTAEVERFIKQQALPTGASTGQKVIPTIIRIPVVVHVLYNTAAQNISEAQIHSGIAALNRDFRKQNPDTLNTPDRFKPVAADVQIEFVLATADPLGRATNGIVRKWSAATEWKMDDKIKASKEGGADAWDAKSYLNIWIGNMRSLLGYSSAPGSAANLDGLVINPSAFGTENVRAPYHLGRTAVHEVGHWLGLKHIWGDTYCGDDGVEDTPKQGNFTAGCPDGFRTSCTNGEQGDMYMNYMDFTNDACMNLFTKGQKQRMRALFSEGGARSTLLSSKGLLQPWNTEAPVKEEIPVTITELKTYPNPATSELTIDLSFDDSWIGKELSLVSTTGMLVKKITLTTKTQKISVTALKAGIYFIRGENGAGRIMHKLIKL